MAKKETTKKTATKKKVTVKKEEPVVVTQSEPEAIPTVEDAEKALDIMNGDPAVVAPVEEEAPVEAEIPQDEQAPEVKVEAPAKEIKPAQPAEEEPVPNAKKMVHHAENKPKKSVVRRTFGYLWNGQEMDY